MYVLNLVLRWIEKTGGVAAMGERNAQKARLIYDAIDKSGGFYRGHAEAGSRSLMNVVITRLICSSSAMASSRLG